VTILDLESAKYREPINNVKQPESLTAPYRKVGVINLTFAVGFRAEVESEN